MKFLVSIICLCFSINSISQVYSYDIKRLRVHVKNEVTNGDFWQTDAFNKEYSGTIKINAQNKELPELFISDAANPNRYDLYLNFKRAKFDPALNAYAIYACRDKFSGKFVAVIISSMDLTKLKYLGIITNEGESGLELAMYHFTTEEMKY